METKYIEYGYCLKCGERYKDDEVSKDFSCKECGGKTLVLSDKFIRDTDEKTFLCICLNQKFKEVFHLDYSYLAKSVYACSNCNNHITIDTYRPMF